MLVTVLPALVALSLHTSHGLECAAKDSVITLKKGEKKELSFWTDSSSFINVEDVTTPTALKSEQSPPLPKTSNDLKAENSPLHNLLILQNLYGNVSEPTKKITQSFGATTSPIPTFVMNELLNQDNKSTTVTKLSLKITTPKKPPNLLVYIPGDVFHSHFKKPSTSKPKYPTFIIKPIRVSSKYPLKYSTVQSHNDITSETTPSTSIFEMLNEIKTSSSYLGTLFPSTQLFQTDEITTQASYIGEPTIKEDVFDFPPSRDTSTPPFSNEEALASFDKVINSVKSVINGTHLNETASLPDRVLLNFSSILGTKLKEGPITTLTEVIHGDDIETYGSIEADSTPKFEDESKDTMDRIFSPFPTDSMIVSTAVGSLEETFNKNKENVTDMDITEDISHEFTQIQDDASEKDETVDIKSQERNSSKEDPIVEYETDNSQGKEEFPPKVIVIDKIDNDVILLREGMTETTSPEEVETTTLYAEDTEIITIGSDMKEEVTKSGDKVALFPTEIGVDYTGTPYLSSLYESTVMTDVGIVGNVLKGNELDKHISSVFVNDFKNENTTGIILNPETLATMGAVLPNSSLVLDTKSGVLFSGPSQNLNVKQNTDGVLTDKMGVVIQELDGKESLPQDMNIQTESSVGNDSHRAPGDNSTSHLSYSTSYLTELNLLSVENNEIQNEETTTSNPKEVGVRLPSNSTVSWHWAPKNPFIQSDYSLQNIITPSKQDYFPPRDDVIHQTLSNKDSGSFKPQFPPQVPHPNKSDEDGSWHYAFPHSHIPYHSLAGYPINHPHGYFPPPFPLSHQAVATVTKVDIHPHLSDNKFGVPHEVDTHFRPVFPQYGFQPPRYPVQKYNLSNSFGGFTFKPQLSKRPDPVSSLPINDPVLLVFETLRSKYKVKPPNQADGTFDVASELLEGNPEDRLQPSPSFSILRNGSVTPTVNNAEHRIGSDEYVLNGIYQVLHSVTSQSDNKLRSETESEAPLDNILIRSNLKTTFPSEETLLINYPDPFFEIPAPDLAQEKPEDMEEFLKKLEMTNTGSPSELTPDGDNTLHEGTLESNDFNSIPSYQFPSLPPTRFTNSGSEVPQYVPFDITPNPPNYTTAKTTDSLATTMSTLLVTELDNDFGEVTTEDFIESGQRDAEASLRSLDDNFYRFLDSQSDEFKRSFLYPKAEPRSNPVDRNVTTLPLNCQWTIKSSPNMYLLLTFKNLSAPHTIDCVGAFIEVERENNGFTARWCGNKVTGADIKRPQVILARNEVKITVFDKGEQHSVFPTGFEATVEVMDLKSSDSNESISTSQQELFSGR